MSRLNVVATRGLIALGLLALAACGGESSAPNPPAASTPAASAPAAPAEAPTEATPAAVPADAAPTQAAAAEADAVGATPDAPSAPLQATAADAAPAQPVVPEGPEPRLGTDYQPIDPPQTLTSVPGKVEIAEVFSYTCIHCARLQPLLPAWEASLPPQVNFVQAPMSHGAFEPIARGFYAAQAMGVLEQTQAGMFKALAEQQRLGAGKIDDIAKLYAELGVDAEAFKATAASFAVNTQISRSQKTLVRWGVESTPTLVVAGKYRVPPTGDRGHEGMLQTARWLAQREIAQQQAAAR
ncbi:MAG TPA: thiol:disulfide interchange protein DsbA/DsbL [Chiayiivirga sp.]|mgnify:CR=1 FL=1|nr:thiol:disulfide interchange protein DsbA/DsbL [Chiayiivirga sp.]